MRTAERGEVLGGMIVPCWRALFGPYRERTEQKQRKQKTSKECEAKDRSAPYMRSISAMCPMRSASQKISERFNALPRAFARAKRFAHSHALHAIDAIPTPLPRAGTFELPRAPSHALIEGSGSFVILTERCRSFQKIDRFWNVSLQ
jgi:hypothetical protein